MEAPRHPKKIPSQGVPQYVDTNDHTNDHTNEHIYDHTNDFMDNPANDLPPSIVFLLA